MIFTPRLSKAGLMLAMVPSSVVQTGVKSLGCEKRTAQESPIQSWKLIFPSVVSASKSGAVSPIVSAMWSLLIGFKSGRSSRIYVRLRSLQRREVLVVAPDPRLGELVGLHGQARGPEPQVGGRVDAEMAEHATHDRLR